MSRIEQKLMEMGIVLPGPIEPKFSYVPAKTFGNFVYTSGQDCRINGVLMYEGKVGAEVTLEQGREAARQTGINLLTVLKHHLGDLDRIKQFVKVLGWVNSAEGFSNQPLVINGCSDFFEEVFGEKGKHARSAVSANELPFNTPVEIEIIVEIED
ncbi:RidA family protein [Cohnella thailandensis]|uniref:RidA family protein n=1 Tax=Cohnella thailandensis TaxID=557557 RepID=A0A841STJ1_9BACL|nr:RidA family protein [Cohnella thailandensis]MBB6635643.1 RidA family protein [Cohnella thailandensis]MBP1976019.1 enamine deaminase RidA (YjgF/YER057c/UK114 family) [Cohnella thailandensis]